MTEIRKSDAQLDAARFWEKVDKTRTCWLWADRLTDGYGGFRVNGRWMLAHRVSWLLDGKALDPDLTLDHLCRVRHCVRPDHLRQVTNRENVLSGFGPPATNARKTHCVRGHELAGANLIIRPNGHRGCRECTRGRQRKWWRVRHWEGAA